MLVHFFQSNSSLHKLLLTIISGALLALVSATLFWQFLWREKYHKSLISKTFGFPREYLFMKCCLWIYVHVFWVLKFKPWLFLLLFNSWRNILNFIESTWNRFRLACIVTPFSEVSAESNGGKFAPLFSYGSKIAFEVSTFTSFLIV